jgi:NAD(P)-dependent dehydrogenase (short-subunit alcohol dehydrogenase family)
MRSDADSADAATDLALAGTTPLPSGLSIFDLTGLAAVVTGASQGLGRQMAKALAAAGAGVTVAARRERELRQLVDEIEQTGHPAHVCTVDLTDPADVDRLLASAVERWGCVDVLVNNAGISPLVKSPLKYTRQEWDQIFNLNAKSAYFCAQAFARWMTEHGIAGSIINIGSTAAAAALKGVSVYAASKAAVLQVTRSLAYELAQHGVRVNALCPGTFESETTADLASRRGAYYDHLLGRIPLGRFGQAGELDGAVVFLASRASRYVTGAVIHVDGGWSTL